MRRKIKGLKKKRKKKGKREDNSTKNEPISRMCASHETGVPFAVTGQLPPPPAVTLTKHVGAGEIQGFHMTLQLEVFSSLKKWV